MTLTATAFESYNHKTVNGNHFIENSLGEWLRVFVS